MERCNCWVAISNSDKAVCYGTKEREECSCDGDVSKCNFYPEKRKEYKGMNTAEMWLKAQEDGKTYECDEVIYNKKRGFYNIITKNKQKGYKLNLLEDIFKFEWQLVPVDKMTKTEAEAKFNIKIVGD